MCTFIAGCSENNTALTDGSGSQTVQTGSNSSVGDYIDLTAMSSTMVYAEINNMMTNPKDYMGKTVKMSGPYYTGHVEETGNNYHYIIIEDATACCQQGLEFIWKGDHTYPDDYPPDNARIEAAGVFGSYEELGNTYYYLAVDDIKILK